MKIFETHAHLYMKDFDDDRESLLQECFSEGIEYIINVGVDKESFLQSLLLSKRYDNLFCSIGFHPHDAEKYDEDFIIKNIADSIAIGEIGLDYYRNLSPKDIQIDVFKKQIALAKKFDRPIILHDREAHKDCYDILKNFNAENVVFHSFSGDLDFAKMVLEQGWYLAFNGIITFKNSHLSEVVKYVPLDRFFVETDSPYLSPHPKRGKRNSPLNLIYIIDKIAELKGVTSELVAKKTFENAKKFFRIDNGKK